MKDIYLKQRNVLSSIVILEDYKKIQIIWPSLEWQVEMGNIGIKLLGQDRANIIQTPSCSMSKVDKLDVTTKNIIKRSRQQLKFFI